MRRKREIWNALSKESKSTITNLTDYLKETTVEVTVTKGKYKGEKR